MKRRDFVHLTGSSAGLAWLPRTGSRLQEWSGSLTPIPNEDRKPLADAALGAARSAGATYADVRLGRYPNQFINARDTKIQGITNTESYGVGEHHPGRRQGLYRRRLLPGWDELAGDDEFERPGGVLPADPGQSVGDRAQQRRHRLGIRRPGRQRHRGFRSGRDFRNARQTDEGRSFLSKPGGGSKLGEKLVDERVSIWSDPQDKDVPARPWIGNGRPTRRIPWIDRGVLSNLYYSRYW